MGTTATLVPEWANADAGRVRRVRPVWIWGPATDLGVALCWAPVWIASHVLGAAGHGRAVVALFDLAFLASLIHQPLTLPLVYGDKRQFGLRPKLFAFSPLVAVAIVAVAVLLHLWIVVPVAAIWNTVHTIQQRYGLCRIYARKSGYGSARLDRLLVYSTLLAGIALVAATADTPALLGRVELDGTNAAAVQRVGEIRPWAVWLAVPLIAIAIAAVVAVVRQERAAGTDRANPAKWAYQGGSLLLVAAIVIDPIAGLTAYVAAHAIEYAVVVERTLASRYTRSRDTSSPLGRVTATTARRWTALGVFLVTVGALDHRLRTSVPFDGYLIGLYTLGLLHFWYDGFIWKLRRPAVASGFGIAKQPAG